MILGNETSEQDSEDSEDNVPLKELVRKESAHPENVSESKCYEEYILKRNERLRTKQEETVREKSAPKGKDGVANGKTDPKDTILDLVDTTKQHQTSGAKERTSKRKLDDITGVQSGKADPPQPGQPPDAVKRRSQVSISSDLEDVRTSALQLLDDEDKDDDYDDLRGIWENDIECLPETGQISEVVNSVLKLHFNAYTYCVSNTLLICVLCNSFLCNIQFLPVARRK